jgi:hypothetical protein
LKKEQHERFKIALRFRFKIVINRSTIDSIKSIQLGRLEFLKFLLYYHQQKSISDSKLKYENEINELKKR